MVYLKTYFTFETLNLHSMKRITYLSLIIIVFFNQLSFAQSSNNWSIKKESEVSKTRLKIDKKNIPTTYKMLSLDFKSLQTNLKSASKRTQNNNLATTLFLDFPNEDGTMESYSMEKTSVLAPELEAKYPEIQSFYGVSRKNPLNKIYISTSPQGFTGLITGEKTIYIDPVSKNDVVNYIVYDRKDCSKNLDDGFVCNAVMDEALNITKNVTNAKTTSTTDGNLRTYRLAVACTSAYSLYYGNTIPQVLAAMNTTITRVNSIFRRDLSVVFQLVANNDRLIYINGFNKDASPDPDPYDNYNGSGMLSVNTANITGLLTAGAYDIGHVFSTGGGGIAGTGPCTAASKGNGVTGIVTPQFDPFDIDYVCHEIGHQFGAGHTYYNACFGAKVADDYEPGSASTIMGYAGICAPNIQGNSDAYFHARSIEQMTTAIGGHTCVAGTSSGNTAPVISAITSRTIPKSTPFILTGNVTDANTADVLTYTWEQYDITDGGPQPPVATNTAGPVFRSFLPSSSPSRTFPNLAAIISNTTPTWEVLPSVARVMNFRLTARDNSTLGGRTSFANCTVSIVGTTVGPFLVASPNAGTEIWYAGETKAVTWNVAGTNSATYSTTVNIKLSTDGGVTYPIILASGIANSGTANIVVPDNIGKLNRIKVEAAANIFFDISNANFEIKSGKFEMVSAASTQSVCKPANAVYTINYTPAPAFSETTTFSAVGAPAGSTITFSPTTRSISGTFTMTVSNTSGVAAGNYPITIKGISTTANVDFPVLLNVFDNTIGNVTLANPSNGATNQQTSSLLQWNALTSASSYLVQISTSPTFSTITESATVTGTSYQTSLLAQGTINYWRVRPINSCTSGSFSEVYVFQIASDLCKTYSNVTFEPNAVWETNSNNAVSAKITVPDNIIISKVSFYMKGTHAALSDLKMQFSGPTGIFAEIYNRDCNAANFDVTFDDNGTALPVPCSVTLSGLKQASQSLSKFNGSNSLGTWTLLATDRVSNTSGGTFTNFSVSICGKLQIVNNISIVNNPLILSQGATATISTARLAAVQPSATATQLIYTITHVPTNGILKLNNVAVAAGSTFTQTDINNNLLSYSNNGLNANIDSFKFSVNGLNLALLGGQTYTITVNAIGCAAPIPDIANLSNVIDQCSGSLTAPTATSSCYGSIIGTTNTIFPITTQGTTAVSWSFNDLNGNIVTQTQNVIIDDTIAPLIPTLTDITAQCAVTPTAPTTTDTCKGIITGTTSTVFPITNQGSTVVIWTFNDGNGQSVTANLNVIIDDTIAPIIPTLATVNASCSATLIAPTTTDACAGTISGTTTTIFPITTIGTTIVTWTFSDGNGQSVTANQDVNINNTMSAIISGSATTCAGSNAILQVAISGGVSPYTVVYSNGTSNFTTNNYTSGSSIAVTPLITTTYTLVSVTSAEGCLSPANSGSAIINVTTTTWNGSVWSNGAPTNATSAIIAGNYNVLTNINACSLTVNNNAVVTIPSGFNVTLNGALIISSGSFTLDNNANLIQTSNVANSGNIIVKRNGSALLRLDYTLWSAPVTNNSSLFLQSFSPATSTNRFYTYDTATNLFTTIANPSTTNFGLGKGYLIRMPNDASSTIKTNYPGVFTGSPNNGIIPVTLTNLGVGKRFNSIGNPYPSPISMIQFVADNALNITGTLYFWRKTNGLTNPTYCTWLNGTFVSNIGEEVFNPNGIIQTGQGFLVEALNATTTVTFNNGQRVANNANQFFKTKNVEKSTIWLNATNTIGNFSQMAVSYVTNATQGIDDFDGKYYNDGAIALNSFLDNNDYVIQGRALPFDETDEIPLSFKATNAGNYTIAIDHVDGLFLGSQEIILIDRDNGSETNLKTEAYTFAAPAGGTSTRFSLKYQKTLGTNNEVFDEDSIVVFQNNGKINIKSKGIDIYNVKLYDIRGRLLFEKNKVNASETSIESDKYASQVIIVQITSTDNNIVNKKVAN